jgi:hypothetical protein
LENFSSASSSSGTLAELRNARYEKEPHIGDQMDHPHAEARDGMAEDGTSPPTPKRMLAYVEA